MGRSPRPDPELGWHHVMNRGAARQAVFHSAADGRAFEGMLGGGARRFGVEVHAYCLMTNHFHLLLHCPDGGVSDFMQLLGAGYTRYVNDRLGRDGPIFRGRFRSLLIDSDRYLAAVGRYIHRNPLDIGPDVDLATYRWSSFRHYCDPVHRPPWLSLDALMAGGMDPSAYRRLVEDAPSPSNPAGVAWAIRTAVDEAIDDESVPGAFDRTVAVAMLQRALPQQVAAVERWLAFPSDGARRTALTRMRRRCEHEPIVGDLADRALTLLGLPLGDVTNCV